MTSKDDDESDVIHLGNLKKKSNGYYRLKETEILVFVSIKRKFFIFDQENMSYLKNFDNEALKKSLASKTVVLSDFSDMIFNIPKKTMKSKLLDSVIANSGKELTTEEAMAFSKDCSDLDQYVKDIIKSNHERETSKKPGKDKKPKPSHIKNDSDEEEGG